MPFYICPNCKDRSVDIDGFEGMSEEAVACHRCGFGFLFELMDDYYPGPNTGLVACDQEGRILASGRGVFELTGYGEGELMGQEVVEGFGLDGLRSRSRTLSPWHSSGASAGSANSSSCARRRASSSRDRRPLPRLRRDGGLLVALVALR